jgi:hypothetical protein
MVKASGSGEKGDRWAGGRDMHRGRGREQRQNKKKEGDAEAGGVRGWDAAEVCRRLQSWLVADRRLFVRHTGECLVKVWFVEVADGEVQRVLAGAGV